MKQNICHDLTTQCSFRRHINKNVICGNPATPKFEKVPMINKQNQPIFSYQCNIAEDARIQTIIEDEKE